MQSSAAVFLGRAKFLGGTRQKKRFYKIKIFYSIINKKLAYYMKKVAFIQSNPSSNFLTSQEQWRKTFDVLERFLKKKLTKKFTHFKSKSSTRVRLKRIFDTKKENFRQEMTFVGGELDTSGLGIILGKIYCEILLERLKSF